jgi:hypothetical protein
MLTVFDAPDGTSSIGERPETTIAPQALMLMNAPTSRTAARALAERVQQQATEADVSARIEWAYRLVVQRSPTDDERLVALAFLQSTETPEAQTAEACTARWIDWCQVLLCLNEVIYID